MTGKVTVRDKAPVFVVGSARSGNTMLYHMLLSSGRFPIYRTEPCVFDLLVPRFGNFRSVATRRELMRCWVRTRQFRRSGLDAGEITEKVLTSVTTGGEFLRTVMEGPSSWDQDRTISEAIEIREGVVQNPKILSFHGRSPEYPHTKF